MITPNYRQVGDALRTARMRARYDVTELREDPWHAHTGEMTAAAITEWMSVKDGRAKWMLNAGSGVHALDLSGWDQIFFDLFPKPLIGRQFAVCGTVERLPFRSASLDAVVCVGEVLAYCDVRLAIAEFSRVLTPSGRLVLDFGSSMSARWRSSTSSGADVAIVTDQYNGTPETIQIYHPRFIRRCLNSFGLQVRASRAVHRLSAYCRLLGASPETATALERRLGKLPWPDGSADLQILLAERLA